MFPPGPAVLSAHLQWTGAGAGVVTGEDAASISRYLYIYFRKKLIVKFYDIRCVFSTAVPFKVYRECLHIKWNNSTQS